MFFFKLIIKRLIQFLATLFFIVTITFFLMKSLPGDPFTEEQAIPQEILNQLYHYYGLDLPIFEQYLKYLNGIITLNLGPSLKYEGRFVNDIIIESFPISFTLGVFALSISLFFGIIFGTLSAYFKYKWQDRLITVMIISGTSIPSFILATFLQYFLALKLGILPIARWGGISHMILPVISLSILPMSYIARICRNQMIEIFQQDYILFAKTKGLSTYKIIKNHVLKNAILPIITYIGHLSTSILTGSFVIEKIFGIPGLGFWYVSSIANRDYPVIMGLTVFFSFILAITIFLVDISYLIIDPKVAQRLRQSERH